MQNIWPEPSRYDTRNAYFEAGHAIVARLEHLEIERVAIEREGDACSWIDINEPDLSEDRLRSSTKAQASAKSVIRALLAGPAAQDRYSFGACSSEFNIADSRLVDQETAWRAISIAGAIKTKGTALIPILWREVTTVIQEPEVWAAVEAVAAALLRDRELAGCEVEEIARHSMATPNRRMKT